MRSLFFRVALVCGFGLLLIVSLRVVGCSRETRRYAAAKARVTDACRAYRSLPGHENSEVCRGFDEFGPRALPFFKRVESRLDEASQRLARHEARAAEAILTQAMDDAEALDRIGDSIGTMVAAKIVDRVLDMLIAHPELDRRAVLRNLEPDGFRRPFERSRLTHLWHLAHHKDFADAPYLRDETLADGIEADGVAYEAMERAIAEGDTRTCERKAEDIGRGTVGRSGYPRVLCAKLADVVRVQKRLDEVRGTTRPSN